MNIISRKPSMRTREGRFVPLSAYYGDRFPRSMNEAFGYGARLHIKTEQRHRWLPLCGLLALLVVMLLISGV